NSKPMSMNNFTERMHKTVEVQNSGTQTVVNFIERLYGIKVFQELLNGPFQDVCKHVHAARLYTEVLCGKLQIQEIKERLVKHFKNKEYAVAPEKKNYIIHRDTSDKVYQEILRLYSRLGNNIFFLMERKTIVKDPFCPMDSIQVPLTSGAPKNCGAKLHQSHTNEVNQEYTNDNNLENLTLSEISINNIGNEESHSIQDAILQESETKNETATATKRSLEELFLEKECAWNLQEFTNIAVTKKLRLDDDPVENGVKLY
ncbi:22838_t:CDS:2, partial [Gigaspora rosea]